ncbi:hypothetical protein LSCM1_06146 [Leishmania martiniquensis]|uniref:Uncharacterized protein n=1 Tax=Leishmania martiniquensis TaxID=1580590 RepID=A0A836H3B4_9TRYP|nr:hypothetical protein LSCM1_06146 [Leishmania martiniquensis]
MRPALPHCHRAPVSLLPASQARNHTSDRGEHRSPPRAVQPLPVRLLRQTAPSPLQPPPKTAVRGGGNKAAPSCDTPQAPPLFVDAMDSQTQRKLALSHLRTPDQRDINSPRGSRGLRVDLPSRQFGDLWGQSVNDASSDVLLACARPGRGARVADANGVSQSAVLPDEGHRSRVRGPGSPSGRKGASLIMDHPSGRPITLVVGTANPSSTKTKPGNPASMGSGLARLGPAHPAPLLEVAQGSAATKAAKSKVLSSTLLKQPEPLSSPLLLPRQAPSMPPGSVSRYPTGRSHHDSGVFFSASNTSMAASRNLHRSRGESFADSSYTDMGSSSSPSSLPGRRVHFLLRDPTEGDLAAADGVAASVKKSDDTRVPLPRHPSNPVTVALSPYGAGQRLGSPMNSSSSSITLKTPSEFSNGPSQLGRSLGGAETRPTVSSQPRGPSSSLPFQSNGSSVLSLRLNKKEGRIEALPAFAQSRSGGSSGRSASEPADVSSHSLLSPAGATGSSPRRSGSHDAQGSATYQPGQPLPKPALRQVSRYGKEDSAASSCTNPALLQRSNAQWGWWRQSAAAGAGKTAAASPASRSSIGVARRLFADDLRGALVRLQGRVHNAEAPTATSGRAPDGRMLVAAGEPTTSSGRTVNIRGGRAELMTKWLLLSLVALASFSLIFVDILGS